MKPWRLILAELQRGRSCAMVTVAQVKGSAPREEGARMLVTADGFHGTIGGGTLEWRALASAQSQTGGGASVHMASHVLGPDLGQCCGGHVTLVTECFDQTSLEQVRMLAAREAAGSFSITGRLACQPQMTEQFGRDQRRVYLFGAGHVGRALVLAMAPLPFDVHWIDPRPGAFPSAVPQNVTLLSPENPVAELAAAPEGALVLVMTHSHALDLAITDAALRNPACAEVGLIGSATKRARFEHRLRAAGVPAKRVEQLVCPIGMPGIASKEPAAIAISTAAQLLLFDERLQACQCGSATTGGLEIVGALQAGERA